MAYSKEQRREYMRQYRQDMYVTLQLKQRPSLPFVGVDGEGGMSSSGRHEYFLLRAGKEFIEIEGDEEWLGTRRCLDFLSRLPSDKEYIGYFFGYDVGQILRDLSLERLQRLMNPGLRQRRVGGFMPLDWMEFQIDYLPGKEFKVRREIGTTVDDDGKPVAYYSPWIVINDVGPFFQCPFVDAISAWNIQDARLTEIVERGKKLRSQFNIDYYREHRDAILEYNGAECELAELLMELFRDACIMIGYVPSKWQGPGQLAEASFRKHRIPKSAKIALLTDPTYHPLLEFAKNSFYGGRPELSGIGRTPSPTWLYDINSAYPAGMMKLPCLKHGIWRRKNGAIPHADFDSRDHYALCLGTFTPAPRKNGLRPIMWYGLPFRSKEGTIYYPSAGRGWYWNFEIESAIHQHFECEEYWEYTRQCDCVPFNFVEKDYEERLRLGKNGRGIVLKLALNSYYGKQAQAVGSAPYANPIYASFLTAYPRTLIQGFLHSSDRCPQWCGSDVFMIATDGVASAVERPDIPVSQKLGEWSYDLQPNGLFLIQPGVYFRSDGKRAKSRGVASKEVSKMEAEFEAAFERMRESMDLTDGYVYVPQLMYAGPRYAAHRGRIDLLGQWITTTQENGMVGRRMSYDWRTKRKAEPVLITERMILTFPRSGDRNITTTPYRKDIGGLLEREAEREAIEALPDDSIFQFGG